MRVAVGGARLFVEVLGPKLVPDGEAMRERPTILALHGGPGVDHTVFRPELDHWMVDFWVIPGWENPWGLVSSKHPDMMFEPTPWFTGHHTGEALSKIG